LSIAIFWMFSRLKSPSYYCSRFSTL